MFFLFRKDRWNLAIDHKAQDGRITLEELDMVLAKRSVFDYFQEWIHSPIQNVLLPISIHHKT